MDPRLPLTITLGFGVAFEPGVPLWPIMVVLRGRPAVLAVLRPPLLAIRLPTSQSGDVLTQLGKILV